MPENKPHSPIVFDRALVAKRRQRAMHQEGDADFLFRDMAERLGERIGEVARSFPKALHMGPACQLLKGAADSEVFTGERFQFDPIAGASSEPGINQTIDEEAFPYDPDSFDLITSNMMLHWVNDLPGALIQMRRSLRPDGLFLAAIPGENTLHELRQSLMDAEIEVHGGAAARVSPMIDVRTLGSLVGRAGYALPVLDVDRLTIAYSSLKRLLHDLRGMGETNALADQPSVPLTRKIIKRAEEIYAAKFPHPEGGLQATFEIIFLTAWAPHPDQPKPLKPGSASVSLASVLGDQGD